MYLGLGIITFQQGRALHNSAQKISNNRTLMGTAAFADDYKEFAYALHEFSSSVGNPLLAPVFFLLGSPGTFTHSRTIATSADQIAQDLLGAVESAQPRSSGQPGINLDLLAQSAPSLTNSQQEIYSLLHNLQNLHLHGILLPFDSRLDSIRKSAHSALIVSKKLLPLLPAAHSLLGSDSPRTYFVAFQNPAEARGTGGIIGAYALLNINKGHITVARVGSNAELVSQETLPIDMPEDFLSLYGVDPAIWQNSNMSPHFPNAAKIWLALWEIQSGEKLDGVITLDPFVLKQYLQVSGPLTVGNQVITSKNLISETLSREYIRYANDNNARKLFLVTLLKTTLERLTSQPLPPSDFLALVEKPLRESRIYLYSAHPTEQSAIHQSTISGSMDSSRDNTYRLVINNLAGNKMEYYLARKISVKSIQCGKKPITQVDYILENTVSATAKLPPYVNGRLDLLKNNGYGNSTKIEAFLYGPVGSKITGALNMTTRKAVSLKASENKHPVLISILELKPKASIHVRAQFTGGVGPLAHITQPLVRPAVLSITDKCAR